MYRGKQISPWINTSNSETVKVTLGTANAVISGTGWANGAQDTPYVGSDEGSPVGSGVTSGTIPKVVLSREHPVVAIIEVTRSTTLRAFFQEGSDFFVIPGI